MSVASSIGSPFYPPVGTQTLEEVLITGNDANLNNIYNVNVLSTQGLIVNNEIYPRTGNPIPIYPDVGSIYVRQFVAGVPLLSGAPYSTFFVYQKGIYSGKVEVDFIITNNGDGIALVELFYDALTGPNIGYSSTFITGGGVVCTVSVPFFVNVINDGDAVYVKLTCTYSQGGSWRTTTESDIDVLRIF